jgi:transcription antitermination factor NusG
MSDILSDEKKWFVIQTVPRNEKKVLEQIMMKDVEVYLPQIQTLRVWSDRKKKIFVPLIPGYVFVHTSSREERKKAISNTLGAIRYLMYLQRPAIVSDQEIQNIRISLQAPEKVKIEEKFINVGDLVMITHGLFKGLTGYISLLRGNYKLTVNITELETALSVQLSSSDVTLLQKLNKK